MYYKCLHLPHSLILMTVILDLLQNSKITLTTCKFYPRNGPVSSVFSLDCYKLQHWFSCHHDLLPLPVSLPSRHNWINSMVGSPATKEATPLHPRASNRIPAHKSRNQMNVVTSTNDTSSRYIFASINTVKLEMWIEDEAEKN